MLLCHNICVSYRAGLKKIQKKDGGVEKVLGVGDMFQIRKQRVDSIFIIAEKVCLTFKYILQ